MLLDLESLEDTAREVFDGYVSGAGLLERVLSSRQNPRSIAYVARENRGQKEALISSGFDSVVVERDRTQRMIQLAMDAVAVAPRVDALVLATADPSLGPLIQHLRAQGLRVEVASFEDQPPSAGEAVELGRESVVIP